MVHSAVRTIDCSAAELFAREGQIGGPSRHHAQSRALCSSYHHIELQGAVESVGVTHCRKGRITSAFDRCAQGGGDERFQRAPKG